MPLNPKNLLGQGMTAEPEEALSIRNSSKCRSKIVLHTPLQ